MTYVTLTHHRVGDEIQDTEEGPEETLDDFARDLCCSVGVELDNLDLLAACAEKVDDPVEEYEYTEEGECFKR